MDGWMDGWGSWGVDGWVGMKGYRSASWVQTACGRGRIVGQFFRLQMSSVGAPNLVGIDPFERLV